MAIVVKSGASIARKRASVIPNEAFLSFAPELTVSFDTARAPFSELWAKYGVNVYGSALQKYAGFSKSHYYDVRRGERKASPALLLSACMLSKLTPSAAKGLFHDCRDTLELEEYGTPAAVLTYLLNDIHDDENPRDHNYDAFMWYTITLCGDIPEMFRNNQRWADMKLIISEGKRQVYDLDVPFW